MSISLQFKLTQAGQSAAFNATNTGLSLNLTHVQVGSGNKTPTGLETALVSPVASVGIAAGFSVSPSQIRMTAVFSGAASFAVREVGLWSGVPGAAGSVLVCYWSQASGDLVVKASGVDFVFSHDMGIDAAVASGSLTVVADPAQAAVLAMVAAHEQSPDPHKQYTTSVEVQSLIESRLSAAIASTGPANAYVVALSPAITSYTSAVAFSWTTGVANTGAATLNAGGGVKQLRMPGGAQLAAGDIAAGSIVSVVYDELLDAFVVLQRSRVANQVALSVPGNGSVYLLQTVTFTITNFNSFSSYAVTASAGTVSRSGDTITYTAPASPGAATLTVTMDGALNRFPITVLQSVVATPAITSPAAGATGVFVPIVFTSSAFAVLGTADTHLNSDWELSTNAGFTNIVQSSLGSTVNLTSWAVTGLTVNTTYFLRVRHRGTIHGTSAYSPVVSFTTNSTFNSYIPVPVATPAIGAPLEGGFYAGMIWNELAQSSTSTGIGVGSKVFTVPNMVGAPIVYAGQTVEVRSRANPGNKMVGTVTAAVGTGLTINVTSAGGSGTFADWSVMARYRIIVSPKSSGETNLPYQNSLTAAPTACHTLSEGRRATLAMVAAGSATEYPAAHFCHNLSIGGRSDWYLPARDELELCWRNLKPATNNNYAANDRLVSARNYSNLGTSAGSSTSQGANDSSSPAGAAYTATNPAQTSVVAFQLNGSEAFGFGTRVYMSSSEFSDTTMWHQSFWTATPGAQNRSGDGEIDKTESTWLRAVRRSIV